MMLLLLGLVIGQAAAATETLLPEAQETRLRELTRTLRCLVCQNESLAESQAPLAGDLREEIRDQMRAGHSDAEILDYLVARYGDFVTYRPPVNLRTLGLWFGPLLILLALVGGLWAANRQARAAGNPFGAGEDEVQRKEALNRLKQEFGSRDD